MFTILICSAIYNSQDKEATWMSINRRMDKDDVVHTYNGLLLSHKNEWNHVICINMDKPRVSKKHTTQSKNGQKT